METPRQGAERPIAEALGNVALGLKDLVRAEIRLAKTELSRAASNVGRSSLKLLIFGIFAVLGILPFLAFLVLGLGELLGDNYWLSALLVSIFCFAVGGILAYQAWKSIAGTDYTMPATRRSLDQSVDRLGRQVAETKDDMIATVRAQKPAFVKETGLQSKGSPAADAPYAPTSSTLMPEFEDPSVDGSSSDRRLA